MLKICLSRVGKKKQPVYRVIVLEKTKDPWGDYLELLGHYNPRSKPKIIELKADRVKYWLSQGAQASPTLYNLCVDQGIIEGDKIKASSGKTRKNKKGKKDQAEPATKAGTEQKQEPVVTPTDNQPVLKLEEDKDMTKSDNQTAPEDNASKSEATEKAVDSAPQEVQ